MILSESPFEVESCNFQRSAMPVAAVLVGFIRVGTDPTAIVIVPPAMLLVAVQVIVGAVTVTVQRPAAVPPKVTPVLRSPLKENPVAEGEALLVPPGKVKVIVPPDVIAVVIKLIV